MAEQTWTYSDWVTYAAGSSTRLSRLRLHIKEVSDKISRGNYSVKDNANDFSILQSYLGELLQREKEEAVTSEDSSDLRTSWTRGKARL